MMFAGYAALFDVMDKGGDIIRKGAFAGCVGGQLPPFLAEHHARRPSGRVTYLAEDDVGLRVVVAMARGWSVNSGDGLSFGYRIKRAKFYADAREIQSVELIEVSLSANPMQRGARVIAVSDNDNQAALIARFGEVPRG